MPSIPTCLKPLAADAKHGALVGLGVGAIVGAADGLTSWKTAERFLPSGGAKISYALELLSLYAISFGLVFAVGWLLIRVVQRQLATRAARAPGEPLARALLAIPLFAASYSLAFAKVAPALAGRKHMGLVVAVSLAAGAIATFFALLLLRLGERWLGAGLARLGRKQSLEVLQRAWVARTAWLLIFILAIAITAWRAWAVLMLIPLRPFVVTLAAAALALYLAPSTKLEAFSRRVKPRWVTVIWAVPLIVAILLGSHPGVQKAVAQHSGVGGPFVRMIRRAGDWDGDGFARFWGGGDCDDGDGNVHPGASEIPDDGKDNNCLGGDATQLAPEKAPDFAPLPDTIPKDSNIVLITIDTLRSDHVGAYGYKRPTTPALDSLAKEGAVFVNSWAHAPSTRYSIPAILTGRYPLQVEYQEISGAWPGLAMDNTTLAEIAQAHGRKTIAVTNYWYFDEVRKMNQGFDIYDNSNKRLHSGISGEGPAKTKGSSSKEQTDKAITLLTPSIAAPFFLWVHYYDPHAEYEAHAESGAGFGKTAIDLYDGEIRYTDQNIARLFDFLRAQGVWDKTAIIVTGDHGEGFGEHGITMHGYHLYSAQTRVPMIVKVPGIAPSRQELPTSHVDILPTLANLVGASPATFMQGESLLPALLGQRDASRPKVVFQELSYENQHEMRALADATCHVIFNMSPSPSWEVYRIDTDPNETRDLVDSSECSAQRKMLAEMTDAFSMPAGAAAALLAQKPVLANPANFDFPEFTLLDVSFDKIQIKKNETVEMTYTFLAKNRLSDAWKFFVHFESTQGAPRFLDDHAPTRPFSWWKNGQYIQYKRTVKIPGNARGAYNIYLGVFRGKERKTPNSKTGAVTDPKDQRVQIGTLTVTP